MTQSYNLSQLANNLNTAGQLDATDGLSGAVPPANGGTGISTYTVGDILYANGSTALAVLSDVATGNALISGGVGASPSWGKVGMATHVSGTLGVVNGGTGAATLAANNVILGNGTTAVQTVAPGTSGNVLASNGTTWTSIPAVSPGQRAQLFITTGAGQTFTIPTGVTSVKITLQAGGGGGGGQNACNTQNSGPGAAGGAGVKWFVGLIPGNTLTVNIAAGGGGGGNGNNGSTGGAVSVASGTQTITTISATGGGGGIFGGGNGSAGTGTGFTNGTSGDAGFTLIAGTYWNPLNRGMGGGGASPGNGPGNGTNGGVLFEY